MRKRVVFATAIFAALLSYSTTHAFAPSDPIQFSGTIAINFKHNPPQCICGHDNQWSEMIPIYFQLIGSWPTSSQMPPGANDDNTSTSGPGPSQFYRAEANGLTAWLWVQIMPGGDNNRIWLQVEGSAPIMAAAIGNNIGAYTLD